MSKPIDRLSRIAAYIFALACVFGVIRCSGIAQDGRHEGRDVYDAATANVGAATATPASATGRKCVVAKPSFDGDYISCEGAAKPYRLTAVDAPEVRGGQPYYPASRDALRKLLPVGAEVTVEFRGRDTRWARRLVIVRLADGTDIGLAQVKAGNAWFYRQYARSLTEAERVVYATAEADAKAHGRGLWAEKCVVPPWQWRRGKRCGTVGPK